MPGTKLGSPKSVRSADRPPRPPVSVHTAEGKAEGKTGEPPVPLALIVCCARHGVIGCAGGLPWKHAEDLQRFRLLTMGRTLIMGRKTFDSLPHPLDGRTIVVLSRDRGYQAQSATMARSFADAVRLARRTDNEPIVCGGGDVYAEAMPLVTKMYLTEIETEVKGDKWFPAFDEKEWRTVEDTRKGDVRFRTLVRVWGKGDYV